ncbi:C40 family peptidase [uncultured Gelidibacter sp.]|uniref:C40 family peptidase n=1 Tax=uncultured Gelidibacter sp. TaxID=259318 RepID=UPI0026384531|nr:C40 family peptidase [uncultured Gelidibacter sp.]
MKPIVLFLLVALTLSSCKSSQQIATFKSETIKPQTLKIDLQPIEVTSSFDFSTDLQPIELFSLEDVAPNTYYSLADRIVDYAFEFDGVRYKRGGTSKEGMDCSGLVVTTFEKENISLPRVSRDIALTGDKVDLKEVTKGDLLFFATRRNSKIISHVGIVTTVKDGTIEFIHSSTSQGVIVSNMAEKYWHHAFIEARRVI